MTRKNKSLVMVVGAGASKEVNLPLGTELRAKIASLLDIKFESGSRQISGDFNITQAFQMLAKQPTGYSRDINPYLKKCWLIRDAMTLAESIDNFIDAHRGDEILAICAKLAIATAILEAESGSLLKFDKRSSNPNMKFEALENTWYSAFFKLLVEGCQLNDLPNRLSSVAIISFNYDRCIEIFLNSALCQYYSIDEKSANDLLKNLEIYHPYGFIGEIFNSPPEPYFEFGVVPHPTQLVSLVDKIKTFTEGIDEGKSDINKIRGLIKTTDRLAFIGFAFNKQNLNLLYGDGIKERRSQPKIYGTTLGISSANTEIIAEELTAHGNYLRDQIKFKSLTCASFFHEFGRALSLRN